MNYKNSIKEKEVLVDRDLGEAYISVTLFSRRRQDYPTKIEYQQLLEIAHEGGAEMLEIIDGPTCLSNRKGQVTGKWTVKIPTKEPEGSTTSILNKRRKKKTAKESSEQE